MKIIDCTPPADLPDVVLVLDPQRGFWLRVVNETGGWDAVGDYVSTLPGARAAARALGFEPEAWVQANGVIIRF